MNTTFRSLLVAFAVFVYSLPLAHAQRPSAPRLFSNKTLAYLRVDDSRDLKDKLSSTSMGRIAGDPQIGPILKTFYSSLVSNVQEMQQAIGINLDELLSIPNGEMAIALIGTKERPAVCVLIEAGDEMPALELIIGKAEKGMAESGGVKTVKEVGKISVVHLKTPGDDEVGYFIDSGVFVASSQANFVENLARIWTGNGVDHKPLADNRDFTTIMSRCVGTEGERPQVSFFVDPLALVREAGKGNPATLTALTLFKPLGLDGIKAVGGSMIFAPNNFDSIIHGHLLLNANRQGVMRVLRPKAGPTTPESWVGDQANSYMTANWDFAKTIKAVGEIVDTFAGEGTFESKVIEQGSKEIGIDLRKDFLDLLSDRITLSQIVIPPRRINSQANLYCLHVKEGNRFKTEILPKLFEKLKSRESRWTSKQYRDSTIYYLALNRESENIRIPEPAFTVLQNQLILSDAVAAIEEALRVDAGGEDLLSDSIEFKLVQDRIKAQLKNAEVSIMAYQRPEEAMRLMYDLANDPKNIDKLEEAAANNPFVSALVTAVRSKSLPPFEVIAKYLAPGGAFVVDEETGLHYTGFSMRRD